MDNITVAINLVILVLVAIIASGQIQIVRSQRGKMLGVDCEERLQVVETELEREREKRRDLELRVRDKADVLRAQTGAMLILMDKMGVPMPHDGFATAQAAVKREKISLVGVWADVSNLAKLDLRRDLEGVINAGNFVYRPLVGKVSGNDLEQEFLAGGKADILYIAAHADPEGVYFSDQKYSPAWIGEIAAQYGVSLVVLNACKTRQTAVTVRAKGVQAVVYSLRDIPDTTAIGFAKSFFLALALGKPSNEAVESAQRAVTQFDQETPKTAFGSFGSWGIHSDPLD